MAAVAQKQSWNDVKRYLDIILSAKEEPLVALNKILNINFIWCRDLITQNLLERLPEEPERIVLLVCYLNSEVPELGKEFAKGLIARCNIAVNGTMNFDVLKSSVKATALLYHYRIIHEIVALHVLKILFNCNEYPGLSLEFLRIAGFTLQKDNPNAANVIFDKIRQQAQSPDTTITSKRDLQDFLALQRSDFHDVIDELPNLPSLNIQVNMHSFSVKEIEVSPSFGEFQELTDKEYNRLTRIYELVKVQIQHRFFPILKPTIISTVEDHIEADDIEFKKKIYLTLKSSLSADEAAHKILTLKVPDEEKNRVINVIVRSAMEEQMLSKFHSLLCERLLSSHAKWIPAFHKVFNEIYNECEVYTPLQLRIIGQLWGSLIATYFLCFDLLKNVQLTAQTTNAAQRILIKYIFQELLALKGIEQLKREVKQETTASPLRGLFPNEGLESLRYCINFFTAIGLGPLTDEMRERVTELDPDDLSDSSLRGPGVDERAGEDSKNVIDHEMNNGKESNSSHDDFSRASQGLNMSKGRTWGGKPIKRSRTPPRTSFSKTHALTGSKNSHLYESRIETSGHGRSGTTARKSRSVNNRDYSSHSRSKEEGNKPFVRADNNNRRSRTPPRKRGRSRSPKRDRKRLENPFFTK